MSMWSIKYSEVIMGRSHQRGVSIVATLKGRVSGICFVWSGLPHKMLVIDDTGKLPLVFSGVHVYSFPSSLECPIVPKMKKKKMMTLFLPTILLVFVNSTDVLILFGLMKAIFSWDHQWQCGYGWRLGSVAIN